MKTTDVLKEIENIKNQLIEKYKPEKIILFGSAAWGEANVKGFKEKSLLLTQKYSKKGDKNATN